MKRPGLALALLLMTAMLVVPTAFAPSAALADEARSFIVHTAATRLVDRVYVLDSDVEYSLSNDALDALSMGVPLTLQLEIQVLRTRWWWWWDETLANLTQGYQLQYHALTERYVVRNINSGGQETFPDLKAALEALGRVRDLPLLDANLLARGEHLVRVRAALNIEALPAPLRPMAYLSPQWRMSSPWYEWPLGS